MLIIHELSSFLDSQPYEEAKRIRTTNAKPYLASLCLSEQISNTLTGFQLKF